MIGLLLNFLCLQWQSGYSDTFPRSRVCHCKRGPLYLLTATLSPCPKGVTLTKGVCTSVSCPLSFRLREFEVNRVLRGQGQTTAAHSDLGGLLIFRQPVTVPLRHEHRTHLCVPLDLETFGSAIAAREWRLKMGLDVVFSLRGREKGSFSVTHNLYREVFH